MYSFVFPVGTWKRDICLWFYDIECEILTVNKKYAKFLTIVSAIVKINKEGNGKKGEKNIAAFICTINLSEAVCLKYRV